jgi:hypothetical protein
MLPHIAALKSLERRKALMRSMDARIIHVGEDDRFRIAVLKSAGYHVQDCNSFAQVHAALLEPPPADAVLLTESGAELPFRVVSLVRATTLAPVILFQQVASPLPESEFDLVIPPRTVPREWLSEVEALIARSRALRAESQVIRERSETLRRDVGSVIERFKVEQERSRIEVERHRRR